MKEAHGLVGFSGHYSNLRNGSGVESPMPLTVPSGAATNALGKCSRQSCFSSEKHFEKHFRRRNYCLNK